MTTHSFTENKAAAFESEEPARIRSGGWLAGGGLIAALGAISCCILPLALFSLGITGAWIGNLTALSAYQPYFIGGAVVFLALGFWIAYRKPKAECADGSFCASPRSGRLMRIALWVSALLVALAVAFNYLAPTFLAT